MFFLSDDGPIARSQPKTLKAAKEGHKGAIVVYTRERNTNKLKAANKLVLITGPGKGRVLLNSGRYAVSPNPPQGFSISLGQEREIEVTGIKSLYNGDLAQQAKLYIAQHLYNRLAHGMPVAHYIQTPAPAKRPKMSRSRRLELAKTRAKLVRTLRQTTEPSIAQNLLETEAYSGTPEWLKKAQPWKRERMGCCHWHTFKGDPPQVLPFYRQGVGHTACPSCEAEMQNWALALHTDGLVYRTRYPHTWADGSIHTTSEPDVIGSYHSSKKLVYRLPGVGPTVGLEIEVVARQNRRVQAKAVIERAQGQAFCESDGSLPSDGFEIVTCYGPHNQIEQLVQRLDLSTLPLISHDDSRCGLHVHIERPKTLLHEAKLQVFFNSDELAPVIKAVARRYNNTYALQDKCDLGSSVKNAKNKSYTRYRLVNFTGKDTVEFRAYRGSVKTQTIMACVELSLAAWRFTRDESIQNLTVGRFIEFINESPDTKYLRTYLHRKDFPNIRVPKTKPALMGE